jgi:dephospho-CoA kinase
MPTLILGLTGLAGCGKGTIAAYLQKRYGAELFKFSTYLSRVLDVMALEHSRDNMIRLSETLRQTFGDNALSHAVARDALASSSQIVVVDGIRRMTDIEGPLASLEAFRLTAVVADPRTRYQRLTSRTEKTDEHGMTWDAFLAQEQRPTEITIPETMAEATLTIENNGTAEELEQTLDKLMSKSGIKPVA